MRRMARRVSQIDIAKALNRLVDERVLTGFRTNFSAQQAEDWMPAVIVAVEYDMQFAEAIKLTKEALQPLGIVSVGAEVGPRSQSRDKAMATAKRASPADVVTALNKLVRDGVITDFKTDLFDKDRSDKPDVAVSVSDPMRAGDALRKSRDALEPLGLNLIVMVDLNGLPGKACS